MSYYSIPDCLKNNRDYTANRPQRLEEEEFPIQVKNAPQPGGLGSNCNDILDFLNLLWPNTPDGWSVLCSMKPVEHHYIETGKLENAAGLAAKLDNQGLDVYHALGIQGFDSAMTRTRRGEDVVAIPGFWCDIDVLGPNHKQESLPKTLDEALEFLESLPWKPSVLVNTGGGIHGYWLFDKPWQFVSEHERKQAETLSSKFGEYIISEGLKRGWKLDNVSDLARILRLPGTHNHKSSPPTTVVMLEHHPERRYALEAFEWLKNFTPPKGLREPSAPKNHGTIADGGRNNTLTSIGGRLRSQGQEYEAIKDALLQANQEQCQPPLPDHEVKSIANSVCRYPKGTSSQGSGPGGALPLTDTGNAARLVQHFGDVIRYCGKWKKWMVWQDRQWVEDSCDQLIEYAKETARLIYTEAQGESDADKNRKIAQHGINSQSERAIGAMTRLAKSVPGMPVQPSEFDKDLMLFNCLSGTLDLRSGALLPHTPSRLISKIAPVEYDPMATCPLWLKFLDRIMGGNQDLIAFLQKAVGYSLTGDITEQVFFMLYGTGANGKSVFLEVLRRLVGDYGLQTDFTTFLKREGEGVRNDLARLKSARFVTASETDSGRQLSEVVIKQVTGGEPISARFLYGEYFDFTPSFKVFLATNHKPQIKNQDNGIWRRVRLIPFTVTIPEDERDPRLAEKLGAELPGILNWAREGCRKWLQERLGYPEDIREATEEYKADMDVLGDFLSECCELGPGYKATLSEIFEAYDGWSKGRSVEHLGRNTFNDLLSVRPGIARDNRTSKARKWKGIRLLPVGVEF